MKVGGGLPFTVLLSNEVATCLTRVLVRGFPWAPSPLLVTGFLLIYNKTLTFGLLLNKGL